MDQISGFESLWVKFEDLSRKMYKKFIDKNAERVDMSDIIKRLANKRISPYKENEAFLKYCNGVRNDGRHAILERKYMIYDQSLFEDFENCISLIEKPSSVYSKSIHNIAKCEVNDHIVDALKMMRDNDYTNIPITENGILKGMLSESSIIKYLADESCVLFDNTSKFCDFPELIDFDKYSRKNILFKKRDERYDTVVSEFIDKYNKGEKITCILITEHGKEQEKIIGLLTPWDIIGKE